MRSRRLSAQRGFTLIEVLVALSIFALVSAMSYTGLTRALETKERVDAERAFWTQMAIGFVRMEQDFSEVRARPATTDDGTPLPPFSARDGGADSAALEFTRAPGLGTGFTGLSRVGYEWADHTLWRVTWPSIDRAAGERPARSALLTGIDSFTAQIRGANGALASAWPPAERPEALPRGIEINLRVQGRGAFTRAFVIHD